VAIPVHNEESNVRALHARLAAVAGGEGRYDWEFILVDDGSRDRTAEIVDELAKSDRRVRLIQFTRNFGHQVAISAGIDAAHGAAVITMDGDLQHPPEVLPAFLRRWEQGSLVVVGIRKDTAADLTKRWTSRLFYWVLARLAEVPVTPAAADFRLIDRQVADVLVRMTERARFLRGLVGWTGFPVDVVDYEEAHREAGVSKFSFLRMLCLAADAITSFSALPLRLATLLGLLSTLVAIAYSVYTLVVHVAWPERVVHGWTSTILAILFLGGVQLFSLGIVGEYIHRIYDEVKGRPLYVVRRRTGFEPEKA
jgi:dolichol-phosphate mannosyltransferase